MVWTIPNILTVSRILAAPCVAIAFAAFERPLADWIAFILFAAAALTDFFDGWLARRLGQVSGIGRMLDPIADKAMAIIALAVLMSLMELHVLIVLPSAVILLREMLVSGLRQHLGDARLAVTRLAKWKTGFQMTAIGSLFLALAMGASWQEAMPPGGTGLDRAPGDVIHHGGFANLVFFGGWLTLWAAALLTAISGWDYFRKGLTEVRRREAN